MNFLKRYIKLKTIEPSGYYLLFAIIIFIFLYEIKNKKPITAHFYDFKFFKGTIKERIITWFIFIIWIIIFLFDF